MTDNVEKDLEKAYRMGIAMMQFQATVPFLVYNPGLGKPPMEFEPGSIDKLFKKLMVFVDTGEMNPT